MQKISGVGHFNNTFVAEDVNTGQQPTQITASWMNAVQDELVNIVLAAALPLDVNNNAQVLEAIRKLSIPSIRAVTSNSAISGDIFGGILIINSSSPTTHVLPAANSIYAGKHLKIFNIGTGIATITRAGSDLFQANATTQTSMVMGAGDTLVIASEGATKYYVVGGTVQQQYAYQFRDGTRYKFLGGGWVIQQCDLPAMALGSFPAYAYSIVFPLTFTSTPYLVGTAGGNANTYGGVILNQATYPSPLSGCYAMAQGAASQAGFVLAIGKIQ
jgi:hypothetical protein